MSLVLDSERRPGSSRMSEQSRILVTGAGGFIGHHLVSFLKARGAWVKGVDLKAPEYANSKADEFELLDLRRWDDCLQAVKGVEEVYGLACDMGGMGFISSHHAEILHNNGLMSLHMLEAARVNNVRRYFFASSACVYPAYRQTENDIAPLREEDAYPAQPQDAYGWEKLMTEQLCRHYGDEYGMQTRIARFHNIFGPLGTWRGGREKAPAAICRKVAEAKLTHSNEIEVWGDGEQTRSFCYIDDCLEGLYRVMHSEYPEPLNVGQDRMISINGLVDVVSELAGVQLTRRHVPGPVGVRGRNSDNTRVQQVLDWRPRVSLEDGLRQTYAWIEEQVRAELQQAGGGSKSTIAVA